MGWESGKTLGLVEGCGPGREEGAAGGCRGREVLWGGW